MPKVQIYILSYNRPEYVVQSLRSVLAQDYPNFDVIISDNSTTEEVQKILAPVIAGTSVKYVRRSPSLSAMNHFNLILTEVTSEYFVLFHDDDVLMSNALSSTVALISKSSGIAAVGTNAYMISGQAETKDLFNSHLPENLTVTTSNQLSLHYLLSETGHVPFPSYLYRTSAVQGLNMSIKQGGKHFDVSFLLKLIHRGNIVWLKEPLMFYRRHLGNDSLKIDLRAILSLCRFMNRELEPQNKWIVDEFKMKHYLLWFYQKVLGISGPLSPHRGKVIRKAALWYLLSHPKIILRYLFKRLAPKRLLAHFNSPVQAPNRK